MTKANKFTKAQEKRIRDVGHRIENARLAMRLSLRQASERTVAPTPTGHITDFTWRRVEKGSIQTGLGEIVYRPKASTLMAIAEVVDLDGEALCREIGLVPPPPRIRATPTGTQDEVAELKTLARELLERLDRLEGDVRQ